MKPYCDKKTVANIDLSHYIQGEDPQGDRALLLVPGPDRDHPDGRVL